MSASRITPYVIFFTLSSLTATAAAATESGLSFSAAEQRLRQQSWQLQAHQADVSAWQQQANALKALDLPQLDITVAAIAYEKDLRFDDPALPVPLELDVFRSGIRSTVNLVWPLYSGGRISAAQQQAAGRITEAQAEQLQTVQQISTRLLELYFSQQMLQQVVKVRQQALNALQTHVHKARRFEAEGVITKLNRMQAEVAQAEANRDLLAANRQLADVSAALASLLQQPQAFCLSTPLPHPVALPHPVSWFSSIAAKHNPQLAQLNAKDQQLKQQLKIEQGKLLPEVFVVGAYDLNRTATPMTEPDWKVGLGVRWALTTATDRHSSIGAVTSRQQQLYFSSQQAAADIQLAVESSYRAVEHYLEQFTLLQQDIELAAENARLQQRAFDTGLATSLDVTDSQLKLAAAQVQLLQAANSYISTLARLTQLSGQPDLLSQLLPAISLAEASCH